MNTTVQLKKIEIERSRYIKTGPLQNPLEWMSELALLKEFLARNSNYQIVGSKVYFEIDAKQAGIGPKLMLEIIGVPVPNDIISMEIADLEARIVYVHQLTLDLFQTDYDEIESLGRKLYMLLAKSHDLGELFHIVYDNAKIELHFFSQKDYIQKQF